MSVAAVAAIAASAAIALAAATLYASSVVAAIGAAAPAAASAAVLSEKSLELLLWGGVWGGIVRSHFGIVRFQCSFRLPYERVGFRLLPFRPLKESQLHQEMHACLHLHFLLFLLPLLSAREKKTKQKRQIINLKRKTKQKKQHIYVGKETKTKKGDRIYIQTKETENIYIYICM